MAEEEPKKNTIKPWIVYSDLLQKTKGNAPLIYQHLSNEKTLKPMLEEMKKSKVYDFGGDIGTKVVEGEDAHKILSELIERDAKTQQTAAAYLEFEKYKAVDVGEDNNVSINGENLKKNVLDEIKKKTIEDAKVKYKLTEEDEKLYAELVDAFLKHADKEIKETLKKFEGKGSLSEKADALYNPGDAKKGIKSGLYKQLGGLVADSINTTYRKGGYVSA